MNPRTMRRKPQLLFFLASLITVFVFSGYANAANTVSGTVYDRNRNPLPDIDIELLDDYYRLLARTKTNSSGRYEFTGLRDGRFFLRVYAFRYDLTDETRPVEFFSVVSVPGQEGSSFNIEDFYLEPRKGGLRDLELAVVYAQEVPKEAEKVYKQAVEYFSKKRADEGFAALHQALSIFPTYYQALQLYGQELLTRDRYLEAAEAFMKAVEVNPRSAMNLYYLGLCFSRLGKEYHKAALTALTEAARLAPESVSVLLQMGIVERSLGKFKEAETHLLLAKKKSQVKNPEIFKELAQLYANDLKRYAEAADALEDYLASTKMSSEEAGNTKKVIANLRQKAQQQVGN